MKPEQWQEINRLFHSALEREPTERRAFLDEACAGDELLRGEVEALIAAHEQARSFIETPALQAAARSLAGEQAGSLTGQSVGHYRVIEPLGAGGMGEVYLAQDVRLNRKVALKVLPVDLISSRERLRRFEQEARAASALNHPNIITIHEIGAEGDNHFIATEYIEGETLRRKLQTTRLEVKEALDIAAQIAAALNAAHRSGIVHRDIKPENVMLREDGLVKVLDFGLAKLTETRGGVPVDTEAPTLAQVNTQLGMILGTVAYMSPEQARGLPVDARTDVWSLGVVLHEMLVGKHPFARETTSDVIAAVLQGEPASLAENAPAELQRIVRKSLQKNADERYQTAKDLLIDLKALKHELDLTAELGRSGKGAKAGPSAPTRDQSIHTTSSEQYMVSGIKQRQGSFAVALAVLLLAALGSGYWFYSQRSSTAATKIESIAVLPFFNESGNPDVEYLTDGMTESLINSLSQLPGLNVKARSSVFRYKGKEVEPGQVASQLYVQAVLNGRVVQRGDDLALYLSLVDARSGNQLWGEQYNRKLTDLVSLQGEIARDVSRKLRARLSGADEQKLAKNYTENVEAYQLYLRGRYHVLKLTRSEIQAGISYYRQAIEIDPNYALAYVGLAEAYRAFTLNGENSPTEFLPKAKAAAQKALEIDDGLAEAHAQLGYVIFFYDRDWKEAEKQYQRALELNPGGPDTHQFYGNLLLVTGRHAAALAEAKRAQELDPLNVRIGAIEGQFLIYAGRPDEALSRLQKTLELDPDFWFAHAFASSAYIDKGMYSEAVAEALKARESAGASTYPTAFLGYALAKAGKQAEARAVLEELLTLSKERHVHPYHIALIYNGLNEHDQTLAWLERGFEQHDPRMVFLKVEPKWNNLHGDQRFQDLLRRVGLTSLN